ncbi:MAG: hypothetical protein ACREQ2_22090 [Candidatus Binatia bacterium]
MYTTQLWRAGRKRLHALRALAQRSSWRRSSDREIDNGNHEPEPDKNPRAINWLLVFSLVDLSGDKDKHGQQNKSDHRQSKPVIVNPHAIEASKPPDGISARRPIAPKSPRLAIAAIAGSCHRDDDRRVSE